MAWITVSAELKQSAYYLTKVPEKVQIYCESRYPTIKRGAKRVVKKHLTKPGGVDQGVYKRSFTINNYSESKWQLGFQVVARKPHYRLTHLLEHGHESKVFKWGQGRPTIWGNVGMVNIGRRGMNVMGASQHIQEGQDYAEKKVIDLYIKAVNHAFDDLV